MVQGLLCRLHPFCSQHSCTSKEERIRGQRPEGYGLHRLLMGMGGMAWDRPHLQSPWKLPRCRVAHAHASQIRCVDQHSRPWGCWLVFYCVLHLWLFEDV